jgi:hypothetical protein
LGCKGGEVWRELFTRWSELGKDFFREGVVRGFKEIKKGKENKGCKEIKTFLRLFIPIV